MYIWMRTKNRGFMSANHGKCAAVAWSCTSVIYSCLYGVQDLRYTSRVSHYSFIAKYGKLLITVIRILPCSLWACKMVRRREEKECRGRRLSPQELLAATEQSGNVTGWASRFCNQPFFLFSPLNHDIWRYITLWKQRSAIDAAISAPNPPVIGASWLTCYSIFWGDISSSLCTA